MNIGLSIGDDEELIILQLLFNDPFKMLFFPGIKKLKEAVNQKEEEGSFRRYVPFQS